MPYIPPESNAYTFVLRPNGELRNYVTYDTIDRLYIDNCKIIDARWQRIRNLKDLCYKLVWDISEGESPAPNRIHFYVAMNEKKELVPVPLMFNAFSIPSFKSKTICKKAIKRIRNHFNEKELWDIFNDI